ncbi:hypothetical protein BBJ28_00020677, partial [Nothophytophthora sp. Chile5]
MGKIEDRLAELGYELPAAGAPKGNYVNIVRTGDFLYTGAALSAARNSVWIVFIPSRFAPLFLRVLAGHLPISVSGELITGKLGKDLTTEEGYAAAHRVALALLATLKS